MDRLTNDDINAVFRKFGLGTEEERLRLINMLEIVDNTPRKIETFESFTTNTTEEESNNARLAPN
jgi:hypothetical protein